jgi:ATP-dependent exoDNAse (exonuclease V) beta subunit
LGAADRGTLAHELLERLELDGRTTPIADVRALAAGHGLELSDDEAAELAELVDRFAASGLAARLRAAPDVRREARFGFVLGPGDVVVGGAMDVLAREADQTLVVDYKSDRLEGRDPAAVVEARYGTQRVVYALAALRSGAERVEIAHCFLERPDEPVCARFTLADVPSLETSLSGLADGVLAGSFEVAQNPHADLCLGCPAQSALCSWPEEMTLRPAPAA